MVAARITLILNLTLWVSMKVCPVSLKRTRLKMRREDPGIRFRLKMGYYSLTIAYRLRQNGSMRHLALYLKIPLPANQKRKEVKNLLQINRYTHGKTMDMITFVQQKKAPCKQQCWLISSVEMVTTWVPPVA